jgi:hypothetical protein
MPHLNLVASILRSNNFPVHISCDCYCNRSIVIRFTRKSVDVAKVCAVLSDMIEDGLVNVRAGVAGCAVVTVNE